MPIPLDDLGPDYLTLPDFVRQLRALEREMAPPHTSATTERHMEDPKPLNPGDACPACGGTLVAAPVPSAEQRRRFEDRELREPYPRGFDTMSENQRAEHGALFRCHDCSYQTRFPLDEAAGAETAAAGAGRSAPRRGRADKA